MKKKIEDPEDTQREKAAGCSEAEMRYSAVFEQSPDGILIVDTDGRIIDFNESAHRDLGYSREEFAKFSIFDIDPFDSPEEFQEKTQRIINEKKAEFEVRHQTKSGQIRDVLVICQTIILAGRTVIHAIWRDITAQKAIDKKVRHLASILENIPDAVCSMDAEGRIVSWNEGAERMLGYTADEILGRSIQAIISAEMVRDEMLHCIGTLNKEEVFTGHQTIRIAKDGRRVPVEISGLALRDGQKITGYASIMRDTTGRNKAEETLKQSEHRLKEAQKTAHIGDWEWDIPTNKVYWSDELFRIYGYAPYEIQPDYGLVVEAMHPDSKSEFLAAIDAALKGLQPFEMDYTFFRRDGVVAVLHTIGKVFRDAKGNPVRMTGTVQDITERKQAEEALAANQKFLDTIFESAPT